MFIFPVLQGCPRISIVCWYLRMMSLDDSDLMKMFGRPSIRDDNIIVAKTNCEI